MAFARLMALRMHTSLQSRRFASFCRLNSTDFSQHLNKGFIRSVHTTHQVFTTSSSNGDDNNEKNKQNDKQERLRNLLLISLAMFTGGAIFAHWINPDLNSAQDQGFGNQKVFGSDSKINNGIATPKKTISWDEFVKDYLRHGKVERLLAVNITPESADEQKLKTIPVRAVMKRTKSAPGSPPKPLHVSPIIHVLVSRDTYFNLEKAVREAEQRYNIPQSESVSVEFGNYRSAMRYLKIIQYSLGIAFAVWLFRRFRVSISTEANPFNSMMKSYSRGDSVSPSTPQIKFSDIAGLQQAKIEIQEYVSYLKHPERFQRLGAQIPKGALLLGPPGCGKTLLAKAVATESRVPFLVMAGSEFDEVIGGMGAARVRKLFQDARSLKPCIIYIDEIDAIGRKRSESDSQGGHESEHTLNQLLAEMDGMTNNSGVITLASTNRADVLDKALTRPGRFDRHIDIELPTLSERKDLFSMYMKKLTITNFNQSIVHTLAHSTPGMSGADIANICNEAALYAARQARSSVKPDDFQFSLSRVIAGQAKINSTLSPNERKTVAYHECGHVITSWMQKHPSALLKVSIIPRTKGALGFAQYIPEDRKFYSKEELFQQMVVLLGGRAAEAIFFNRITTGAADDLDKVSQLAKNQVKKFGMSDTFGLLSFNDSGGDFQTKPYSKSLQRIIDQETSQLVNRAYRAAELIITENREKLDVLAKLLLEKEEMTYDDVKQTIGLPPHGDKTLI